MAELSFEQDIRPLFRDQDVRVMLKISGLDLSSYETVKEQATGIHNRLDDQSMPCDEPWPQERIDLFQRWIDEGLAP